MSQALDRVEVEGFKSLRNVRVELRRINVLVGANGVGKSNFLEVFDLVGEMLNENLRTTVARLGGSDRLLYAGSKTTSRLRIKLDFGRNGYEAELAPSQGGGLYYLSERCRGTGIGYGKPYTVNLGKGHVESALPAEAHDPGHGVARWTIETMASWRRFHFHDTSASSAIKQLQPLADNRTLRRDAANLAPFLYRLRQTHPAHYARIVDAVGHVAPFFKDFDLSPDPLNEHMILLQWRPTDRDQFGSPHALSDGTLRFMCLATLLLQPEAPSLILIDEPELGLHPFAIVELADLIRSASVEHQLIISTQSVTLLNQFDVDDVIVADRKDGATVLQRLDIERLQGWLEEYAIGEVWEKNLIGGRPSRAD